VSDSANAAKDFICDALVPCFCLCLALDSPLWANACNVANGSGRAITGNLGCCYTHAWVLLRSHPSGYRCRTVTCGNLWWGIQPDSAESKQKHDHQCDPD